MKARAKIFVMSAYGEMKRKRIAGERALLSFGFPLNKSIGAKSSFVADEVVRKTWRVTGRGLFL